MFHGPWSAGSRSAMGGKALRTGRSFCTSLFLLSFPKCIFTCMPAPIVQVWVLPLALRQWGPRCLPKRALLTLTVYLVVLGLCSEVAPSLHIAIVAWRLQGWMCFLVVTFFLFGLSVRPATLGEISQVHSFSMNECNGLNSLSARISRANCKAHCKQSP